MAFVIIFLTMLALVVTVGVLIAQVARNARDLEVVEGQLEEMAHLLETHRHELGRINHKTLWSSRP